MLYRLLSLTFAAALIATTLSSCYPMPTDEDYCLIPTTNNPSVTKAKGGSMLPSTSY